MPTLPKEIIDELNTVDQRFKMLEESAEISFEKRQEIRRLRFELFEPLNWRQEDSEGGFQNVLNVIRSRLRRQASLLERMEQESKK